MKDANAFLSCENTFRQLDNFCLQPIELNHMATTEHREKQDMEPLFWVLQLKKGVYYNGK